MHETTDSPLPQAVELAQLVELEARWENLPDAPARSASELAAKQGAYEAYRSRRAAYNGQYKAAHDPRLRARYAARRAELNRALARTLEARMEHLGAPPLGERAEGMAAALLGLARGLAQQRLLDPDAVPDDLFGDTLELIYRGWLAVNGR